MNLINMFYKEIEDAKARKVPLILPIGTMEYHGEHASLGTDTMVITGVMEKLAERKEIIVAPPIWYGVASYAVSGPEKNTIQVDCDPYEAYITEILNSLVYGGWKNIYLVFHHLLVVSYSMLFLRINWLMFRLFYVVLQLLSPFLQF